MKFLARLLLILPLLPLLSHARVQAQTHRSHLPAQSAGWEAEIEAHIKTLTRPMDIYTWDTRVKMGSRPGEAVLPNDPRALAFLQHEAAKFYNPQARLEYEGPNGVYFASGPLVSREWGSGQHPLFSGDLGWMMIRVRLPAGTRYLDGRSKKPFGAAMLALMTEYRCGARTMRELLEVNKRSDRRQCWSAYTQITQRIQVYVMAKEFISVAPDYCPIQNSHYTDFIVVDDSVMRDYAVFVPEIPQLDAGNLERYFIRDYWLLGKQTIARKCAGVTPHKEWWDRFKIWDNCKFFVTSPNQFELPWNLPASPYTPLQMKAMADERIFGCGPKANEDKP